mgnify:CR=1 FL=1
MKAVYIIVNLLLSLSIFLFFDRFWILLIIPFGIIFLVTLPILSLILAGLYSYDRSSKESYYFLETIVLQLTTLFFVFGIYGKVFVHEEIMILLYLLVFFSIITSNIEHSIGIIYHLQKNFIIIGMIINILVIINLPFLLFFINGPFLLFLLVFYLKYYQDKTILYFVLNVIVSFVIIFEAFLVYKIISSTEISLNIINLKPTL